MAYLVPPQRRSRTYQIIGFTACNGGGADGPQRGAIIADAATGAGTARTFGAPIRAGVVTALSEVAKSPASFKNKTILAEGTVTRVCQEQGCWLAIRDHATDATVRMHGHAFFVPTTCAGKHARVAGTVVLTKDGHECDEMEAAGAALEIDAVGIELVD